MPNPDDSNQEKVVQPPSSAVVGGDLENQTGAAARGGVSNILRRWKREVLLKRGSLASRVSGFVFSLLAFVIMASNQHGDWKDFYKYEEYRYVLAIAILSTLYTGLQAFRQIRELSTGRELLTLWNSAMFDFIGDQEIWTILIEVVAYLLISAASSAVPQTNRMREGSNNIFTDSSASAISMEFFAFFALALSALISGYKLSNRTYI